MRNTTPPISEAYRDGLVLRWHSNDRVPPADVIAAWQVDDATRAACDAARDAELAAFLADYRQARDARTPEQRAEERAEARAAHGPGVELVDVLTGERFRT